MNEHIASALRVLDGVLCTIRQPAALRGNSNSCPATHRIRTCWWHRQALCGSRQPNSGCETRSRTSTARTERARPEAHVVGGRILSHKVLLGLVGTALALAALGDRGVVHTGLLNASLGLSAGVQLGLRRLDHRHLDALLPSNTKSERPKTERQTARTSSVERGSMSASTTRAGTFLVFLTVVANRYTLVTLLFHSPWVLSFLPRSARQGSARAGCCTTRGPTHLGSRCE